MPVLIMLALAESKPLKTLPPDEVGRCSGAVVEAPNSPFGAPFCCKLLNREALLAFGVSSGLLAPLGWPKLPPVKRLVLGFGVSVVKRLVLGLGVSADDANRDDFAPVCWVPKPPRDGVAGALSPFGCCCELKPPKDVPGVD